MEIQLPLFFPLSLIFKSFFFGVFGFLYSVVFWACCLCWEESKGALGSNKKHEGNARSEECLV